MWSGYLPKSHWMLRRPRKVTLQLHQTARLPRKWQSNIAPTSPNIMAPARERDAPTSPNSCTCHESVTPNTVLYCACALLSCSFVEQSFTQLILYWTITLYTTELFLFWTFPLLIYSFIYWSIPLLTCSFTVYVLNRRNSEVSRTRLPWITCIIVAVQRTPCRLLCQAAQLLGGN